MTLICAAVNTDSSTIAEKKLTINIDFPTPIYELTFNTNGGSSIPSISSKSGSAIDLSDYKTTKDGYVFTGWYSDADLTDKITSIKMNGNKTVYAGWEPNNPFNDVSEKDWFFEDVLYVYDNNLMNGMSINTFSPNVATTRGMIVTVLYRLEGSPTVSDPCPFDDVKSGMYYEDPITWAAANNIVNGYGEAKFGENDNITREQLAAILHRFIEEFVK